MFLLLVLLSAFLAPIQTAQIPTGGSMRTSRGISTIFGYYGDRYGRSPTRCLYDDDGNKRPVDPEHDIGIAHRDLDCGAVVYITNLETGLSIRAVVVDAGPWGAMSKNAAGKPIWYVKKNTNARPGRDVCPSRKCPVGRWRGIADLTPKAAELLGHDGWAKIVLTYDKRDLRSYKRLQKAKEAHEDRRNQS